MTLVTRIREIKFFIWVFVCYCVLVFCLVGDFCGVLCLFCLFGVFVFFGFFLGGGCVVSFVCFFVGVFFLLRHPLRKVPCPNC